MRPDDAVLAMRAGALSIPRHSRGTSRSGKNDICKLLASLSLTDGPQVMQLQVVIHCSCAGPDTSVVAMAEATCCSHCSTCQIATRSADLLASRCTTYIIGTDPRCSTSRMLQAAECKLITCKLFQD